MGIEPARLSGTLLDSSPVPGDFKNPCPSDFPKLIVSTVAHEHKRVKVLLLSPYYRLARSDLIFYLKPFKSELEKKPGCEKKGM